MVVCGGRCRISSTHRLKQCILLDCLVRFASRWMGRALGARAISMYAWMLDFPSKRFDRGRSICNQSLATSTCRSLYGFAVDTQWTHSGHNSGHTVDTAKHRISYGESRELYLFKKALAIPSIEVVHFAVSTVVSIVCPLCAHCVPTVCPV